MFTKAVKRQAKLRLGLFAPSGGGKTYTSLMFAKKIGGKIAYIDTENNSSCKYLGEDGIPEYDIANLPYQEDAGKYILSLIKLIKQAQEEYNILVVDSLTHAWTACKDEVDAAAKRMRSGNSFVAWREGSKLWSQLITTILNCKCHLIVCARSKQEYLTEKDANNKTTIKKVGLAPELRDGMEYELDVVGEIDQEHNIIITKTRCKAIDGAAVKCPDGTFIEPVLRWLEGAEPLATREEKMSWYKSLDEDKQQTVVEKLKGELTISEFEKLKEI